MNKRHVFYVGLVLIAALALFGAPLVAVAAHPPVTVKDAGGADITNGTTPYSPKQTCGGCHFNCADGLYTTTTASFCQDNTARGVWFTAHSGAGTNCGTKGNCPDYESFNTTTVSKYQGYLTSTTTMGSMTYDVTIPVHGASTGKHSTMGRNEGLTLAQRTIWGAPGTISSPGMFGRY